MAIAITDLGGRRGGSRSDPARLGALGARLRRLHRAGVPVPDGFILEVPATNATTPAGGSALEAVIAAAVGRLERRTGRRLGRGRSPMLLAVRTSPPLARIGLHPSVFGIGAGDAAAAGLVTRLGARAAAAVRADFLQSYLAGVHGADGDRFDALRQEMSAPETRLRGFQDIALEAPGVTAGCDPLHDLYQTVQHLLRSRRAQPGSVPTHAVLVQEMALAAAPGQSGTGMLRLRDPAAGAVAPAAAFLVGAPGDHPGARSNPGAAGAKALKRRNQALYDQLLAISRQTEECLAEALDIGFVIESGVVQVVDANPVPLEAAAAIALAVELVERQVIDPAEAVRRVEPRQIESMLHARIAPDAEPAEICRGVAASPGAAVGTLVFSAPEAERIAAQGGRPVLARVETDPADVGAMHAAVAVLTLRGGTTSHAAVVARGLGLPCVTGIARASIDAASRQLRLANGQVFSEGAAVTVDGTAGVVHGKHLPTLPQEFGPALVALLDWADDFRRMRVRVNADTTAEAMRALEYRAEGIGLCRTEHMFFQRGRINAMREMILAESEAERRHALDQLRPMQHDDFRALFAVMRGRPVVVRLLDPPLHEFLPQGEREILELAVSMNLPVERVMARAAALVEFNPMLGNRGCRLGIAYPEIYEMQTRAIIEAAVDAGQETGAPVQPEIMIPLVSAQREMEILCQHVGKVAGDVLAERDATVDYRIGAMIETPRAALRAGAVADSAEFMSFGTNDLTQMAFGMSRDDAGRFLPDYLRRGVFEADPFASLDTDGVGELIALAAQRARATRTDIPLGLCGEHGADAASIAFCEGLGFDYVSCSPLRVPVARLAAAQATLRANPAADTR